MFEVWVARVCVGVGGVEGVGWGNEGKCRPCIRLVAVLEDNPIHLVLVASSTNRLIPVYLFPCCVR